MNNMKTELIKLYSFGNEPVKETYAEGETILADYYPPVMRIVRSEARVFVRSKTLRSDKLTVEGAVEFTVIYLSEGGIITSAVQALPFTHTCDAAFGENSAYSVSASVSYINVRALSPQKLYLKATVEIAVSYSISYETEAAVPGESNIYTRNTEVTAFEPVCSGHKPLKISDEISVASPVSSVLRYDVFFNETEQKVLTGKLITKGDMLLKIVYLCTDGSVSTYEQKVAVSQILDMDGVSEKTVCGVKYSLSDCRVTAGTSSEGNANTILYEMTADIDAIGYELRTRTLCTDAFSSENKVKCTSMPLKTGGFCRISKDQSFRETMEIGLYEKLLDVSVLPVIMNTDYDRETAVLTVSGTFSCKALFTDENAELSSEERELPFSMKIQAESPSSEIDVSADMNVCSFAYVPGSSTGAELRIDCCCRGFLFAADGINVLENVEILDEPIAKSSDRIVLYYAEKDESVWNIAKRYGANPETLMQTNGISEDTVAAPVMLKIQTV